ncbi:helix-turn-helix domain-containing protein [Breznakiella homolactica]|uniref:Helix-turn-helix domain-containing protein n=1 Tax=Breznakiella homolactica TaxID=2798577 RepID=A0A7T7XNG2_9SPIR|nr:helix-turn-helix domain-containing protein [Breznakiella homolactica]QQO09584.1 helix-turn-helix domain-containing protein [Breznakiella homolactica]
MDYENMPDEILTRKETAEYLRICLTTLDKQNIPHVKLGKRVIYRKSVVNQWLEENQSNSAVSK